MQNQINELSVYIVFDISKSVTLSGKVEGAAGLNLAPNSTSFWDINAWNLGGFESNIWRVLLGDATYRSLQSRHFIRWRRCQMRRHMVLYLLMPLTGRLRCSAALCATLRYTAILKFITIHRNIHMTYITLDSYYLLVHQLNHIIEEKHKGTMFDIFRLVIYYARRGYSQSSCVRNRPSFCQLDSDLG